MVYRFGTICGRIRVFLVVGIGDADREGCTVCSKKEMWSSTCMHGPNRLDFTNQRFFKQFLPQRTFDDSKRSHGTFPTSCAVRMWRSGQRCVFSSVFLCLFRLSQRNLLLPTGATVQFEAAAARSFACRQLKKIYPKHNRNGYGSTILVKPIRLIIIVVVGCLCN